MTDIAKRINRDYDGRTLHLVALLENSFVFLADLVRRLRVASVCHFVRVTSHDRNWHGVPLREIRYSPDAALQGKDVLLVEGVVQTGVPLEFLFRSIEDQGASSVRMAALVHKSGTKKVGLTPDYVAFRTQSKFIVGYGLGYGGQYLQLPYIGELEGFSE